MRREGSSASISSNAISKERNTFIQRDSSKNSLFTRREPSEGGSDITSSQLNNKIGSSNNDPYLLQKRAFFWDFLFRTYEQKNMVVRSDDQILDAIQNIQLQNQRVIKADVLRTRAQQFDDELRNKLEIVLTYYCMRENMSYKQGLNEVAAPFVYLLKANVKLSSIYNYFQSFMDKFISPFYFDSDFYGLQCCFHLLQLLMKYHDPQLFAHLSENFATPEIFSTPWFLTLFANKMSLELLYYFWEMYILENDSQFCFFISLSILVLNRNLLLNSDPAMLPQKLSQLNIDSLQQIKDIYQCALKLKADTPISFKIKVEGSRLLDKDYICADKEGFFQKMKNLSLTIDEIQVMPIHPLEVLRYQMSDGFQCENIFCHSNEEVLKGMKSLQQSEVGFFDLSDGSWQQQQQFKICESCSVDTIDRNDIKGFLKENAVLSDIFQIKREHNQQKELQKVEKNQQLVVIDLRRKPGHTGNIPSQLPLRGAKSLEEVEIIARSFSEDLREKQQNQNISIILLNGVYNACRPKEMPYDQDVIYSQEREFEAATLEIFLNAFTYYKVAKVGVVEGGFKLVHDVLKIRNLEIDDHDELFCELCNQFKDAKFKKTKPKNLFQRLADVFSLTPEEAERYETMQDLHTNYPKKLEDTVDLSHKQFLSIQEDQIKTARRGEQTENQQFKNNSNFVQVSKLPSVNKNITQNGGVYHSTIQLTAQPNKGERQETMSNCLDHEGEENQILIQQSTFQVKHATPHKQTNSMPSNREHKASSSININHTKVDSNQFIIKDNTLNLNMMNNNSQNLFSEQIYLNQQHKSIMQHNANIVQEVVTPALSFFPLPFSSQNNPLITDPNVLRNSKQYSHTQNLENQSIHNITERAKQSSTNITPIGHYDLTAVITPSIQNLTRLSSYENLQQDKTHSFRKPSHSAHMPLQSANFLENLKQQFNAFQNTHQNDLNNFAKKSSITECNTNSNNCSLINPSPDNSFLKTKQNKFIKTNLQNNQNAQINNPAPQPYNKHLPMAFTKQKSSHNLKLSEKSKVQVNLSNATVNTPINKKTIDISEQSDNSFYPSYRMHPNHTLNISGNISYSALPNSQTYASQSLQTQSYKENSILQNKNQSQLTSLSQISPINSPRKEISPSPNQREQKLVHQEQNNLNRSPQLFISNKTLYGTSPRTGSTFQQNTLNNQEKAQKCATSHSSSTQYHVSKKPSLTNPSFVKSTQNSSSNISQTFKSQESEKPSHLKNLKKENIGASCPSNPHKILNRVSSTTPLKSNTSTINSSRSGSNNFSSVCTNHNLSTSQLANTATIKITNSQSSLFSSGQGSLFSSTSYNLSQQQQQQPTPPQTPSGRQTNKNVLQPNLNLSNLLKCNVTSNKCYQQEDANIQNLKNKYIPQKEGSQEGREYLKQPSNLDLHSNFSKEKEIEQFYEMLKRTQFVYYLCKNQQQDSKQLCYSSQSTNLQILLISKEFMMTLEYSEAVENMIKEIKSNQYSNLSFISQLNITSFFLTSKLLKITSKKLDKTVNSFYFLMSDLIKHLQMTNAPSTSKLTSILELISNKDSIKYASLMSKDKQNAQNSEENKIVLKVEGEENSQDCLKQLQHYFQMSKNNKQ